MNHQLVLATLCDDDNAAIPNKRRVVLSWSSGKDSAWCLHVLNQRVDIEVVALLTTFNEDANRVAMHAVRKSLVEQQATSVGLPLIPVSLPWPCSNEVYEDAMTSALNIVHDEFGVSAIAFGDLFLEDIRAYREKQMIRWGGEAMFPLWDLPTDALALQMIAAGLKAYLSCVDPRQCPPKFAGRLFDNALLNELPDSVNHCGENGEFHSFVFDGPMLNVPIAVAVGETVERDGFVYSDIIPTSL